MIPFASSPSFSFIRIALFCILIVSRISSKAPEERQGKLFFGRSVAKEDSRSTGNTQKVQQTPGWIISSFIQSLGLSLGSAIDTLISVSESDSEAAKESSTVEDSNKGSIQYSRCSGLDHDRCYQGSRIGESLGCGVPNRNRRIVNGSATEVNEYPWMVGIYLRIGKAIKFTCGGVLISDRYVITAAHCVHQFDHRYFRIIVGDHDKSTPLDQHEKYLTVSSILTHSEYDSQTFNADVGLIKLNIPIKFSRAVRPVCLPVSDSDDFAGMMGTVIGWGRTQFKAGHSNLLLETQVPILSQKQCKHQSKYLAMEIKDSMMCAGYLHSGIKDACEGDSGGPLTVFDEHSKRNVLVGLVSWGEGCGNAGYPGVYTRISKFLAWIASKTSDSCFCNHH